MEPLPPTPCVPLAVICPFGPVPSNVSGRVSAKMNPLYGLTEPAGNVSEPCTLSEPVPTRPPARTYSPSHRLRPVSVIGPVKVITLGEFEISGFALLVGVISANVIDSGIELVLLTKRTALGSTIVRLAAPLAPAELSPGKMSRPERWSIGPVNVLLALSEILPAPSLIRPPAP